MVVTWLHVNRVWTELQTHSSMSASVAQLTWQDRKTETESGVSCCDHGGCLKRLQLGLTRAWERMRMQIHYTGMDVDDEVPTAAHTPSKRLWEHTHTRTTVTQHNIMFSRAGEKPGRNRTLWVCRHLPSLSVWFLPDLCLYSCVCVSVCVTVYGRNAEELPSHETERVKRVVWFPSDSSLTPARCLWNLLPYAPAGSLPGTTLMLSCLQRDADPLQTHWSEWHERQSMMGCHTGQLHFGLRQHMSGESDIQHRWPLDLHTREAERGFSSVTLHRHLPSLQSVVTVKSLSEFKYSVRVHVEGYKCQKSYVCRNYWQKTEYEIIPVTAGFSGLFGFHLRLLPHKLLLSTPLNGSFILSTTLYLSSLYLHQRQWTHWSERKSGHVFYRCHQTGQTKPFEFLWQLTATTGSLSCLDRMSGCNHDTSPLDSH